MYIYIPLTGKSDRSLEKIYRVIRVKELYRDSAEARVQISNQAAESQPTFCLLFM